MLSTRKRVPGFFMGLPTSASSPKTNGPPRGREGKKGRIDGSDGGRGRSDEAMATRPRELRGRIKQQQQQQQQQQPPQQQQETGKGGKKVVLARMEEMPHGATSSAIAGTAKSETGSAEGGRTATGKTEPRRAQHARVRHQTKEERMKQKDGMRVPQQGTDDNGGVAAKAGKGTRGTPVTISSGSGQGGVIATAGGGDDGLGRSAAETVPTEHLTDGAALSSPVDAELPSSIIDTGEHGVGGDLGGSVDEGCGGESDSSKEESSPSSHLSDVLAATTSADSTDDEYCALCTASCWFACSCACHASLAETSSAAAKEEHGKTTRRRAPADFGTIRRKRQRKEREQPQAVTSSNQKEDERATGVLVLDVGRAFLATSESGPRPRAIHFGAAARHPRRLFGRSSGGDGVAAARVSYDISSAEAITYPKVKSFSLSRRARDPSQAKAESAATAAIALAERFARAAPCGTVAGGSTGSPKSGSHAGNTMGVGEEGDEKAPQMMPVTTHEGGRALAEGERATSAGAGTPKAMASESAPRPQDGKDIPTAVVPAAAEAGAGIGGDDTITPVLEEGDYEDEGGRCSRAEAAGDLLEDMVVGAPAADAVAGPYSGQTAALRKQATTAAVAIEAALGEDEGETANTPTTTTSEMLPQVEESARADGGKGVVVSPSTPQRHHKQIHQNRPPQRRTPAPANIPAPGANSSNDAILSNRHRVRAVVFPRPHTHKPRRRPATRARGNELGLPGPGQYDVGGGGSGGGGGGGGWGAAARGPLVAPKRISLTAKARAVVETRKAREACLGGPGEYDIRRAEDITRTRRVVGVVPMQPPPPPPTQGEAMNQESAHQGETEKNAPEKKPVGGWGVGSRSRSRSRKCNRNRNRYRNRSRSRRRRNGDRKSIYHGWVQQQQQRRTLGRRPLRGRPAGRRSSWGESSERHRRSLCLSPSLQGEERKGGEEKGDGDGNSDSDGDGDSDSYSYSGDVYRGRGSGRGRRRSDSRLSSRGRKGRGYSVSRRWSRASRSMARSNERFGSEDGGGWLGQGDGRRPSLALRQQKEGHHKRPTFRVPAARLPPLRLRYAGEVGAGGAVMTYGAMAAAAGRVGEALGVPRSNGLLPPSAAVGGIGTKTSAMKDGSNLGEERVEVVAVGEQGAAALLGEPRVGRRNVGYHDVRRSLTEERAPSVVRFASQARQAEAKEREWRRVLIRRKAQGRRAWASDHEEGAREGGAARGEPRGLSLDDPTRRRLPVFRYVEDKPLPPPAAHRRAEREALQHKRDEWLDVNLHSKWAESPPQGDGGGGDGEAWGADRGGGGQFGKARGREEVEVRKKGEARVKPFDQALRPVDAMGPGRYETEDLARATRTGRLAEPPVPDMAAGLAREEAVGPRGERPVAAEMERQEAEGIEGGVLVLDVHEDVTTRGRRRVPGGVLPSAPRWAEEAEAGDGFPREGDVLDIEEPGAGKDRLGPRRDKGHRYLRFDAQVGRGIDTPPGSSGLGFDFGLEEATEAAGGNVLILNPRDPSDLAGGDGAAAPDIEKQPPRWTDDDNNSGSNNNKKDDKDGDVLDLKPDQAAVRRRVPAAPEFEKQVGRREREAEEVLEDEERLRARREAWGWEWEEWNGKGGVDHVERADLGRRPRAITLVDIEKQPDKQHLQHEERLHDDNDFLLPPSPNLAYRDADYDTDAGVAVARPRASGAVVDMQRGTGRGISPLGGGRRGGGGGGEGRGRRDGSSHGEEAGDELILSPKWSFVATRPDQGIEWRLGATTPRSAEARTALGAGGVMGEEEGDQEMCLDLIGVEAAKDKASRWRGSALARLRDLDMSKTPGRPPSLFGIPERHHRELPPTPGGPVKTVAASAFSDDELRDDRLMEGQRLQLNAVDPIPQHRTAHASRTGGVETTGIVKQEEERWAMAVAEG
eukprot:g11341.t1